MDEHLKKHGMISWSELLTNDLTAAKNFYSQLFGWKLEQACTSEESEMDYTIVKSNDREIAGMMTLPPETAQAPPNWGIYVTVDDVDATASKAEELGAKICVLPQDIPKVGRFCVIQDPQGAFISAITYTQDQE
jgi:predicted enzyme related to lactoylglutathione lyase